MEFPKSLLLFAFWPCARHRVRSRSATENYIFTSYGAYLFARRADAEARALDRPGDRRNVGAGGQAHFAALEIDRDRRGAGAGGGAGDGLYAAIAVHAGDLEDEFLRHVI